MANKNSDFKWYIIVYHNEVTGSRILLIIVYPDKTVKRILIDCGYFQEIDYRYLNYVDDLDPTTIDAIFITHNHIDHTGLLPKFVKQGYRGPIYTSEITAELMNKFLIDSANQQEENARYLKEKYPECEWKFNPLYHREDVEKTMHQVIGVKFGKTIQIPELQGIKATFLINGHILGASMIFLQCSYYGRKPLEFLFTGDYKLSNPFFDVPPLPDWLIKKELIVVHESTYGTTNSSDIKKCFIRNLLEGFKRRQNILIGGFAQGRYQEVLYDLRKLQDDGLIPEEYEICIDGPLGISTTMAYQSILEWFSPEHSDFIPKNIHIVDPKEREHILSSERPRIVVTTSGMLSNGPAKMYVPIFLEHPNAMIHLTGYAAEETLARTLLESKRADEIKIGNKVYKKLAVVKTTREKSSHATLDEMLRFLSMFESIAFLGVNHGETEVQEKFIQTVKDTCPNVKNVASLNREVMYVIHQFGYKDDDYSNLVIKQMPAKLQLESPSDREKKKQKLRRKKELKQVRKAKKKAAKRKEKNKKKTSKK